MTTMPATLIRPLTPADVSDMRLPWSSPFDRPSLAEHLAEHPRRAFWVPHTGEYIVGEPWRHREIATAIVDIVARENGAALVETLRDPALSVPHELLVLTDFAGSRRPVFYRDVRLALMQQVICYELRRIPRDVPDGSLRFERLLLDDPHAVATLLVLDHAAFPWLWWNTVEEFANYAAVPGVRLYAGYDHTGTAVSYVGVTQYDGWGHLDRIGVVPASQGAGYGYETLRFAVQSLAYGGAHRVGLSTQADNLRSQRLYHRFGFSRTHQNDYHIYGTWANPARAATAFMPGGGNR